MRLCTFVFCSAFVAVVTSGYEKHLVVLVHGYSGHPSDFSYLERALKQREATVLCCSANDGRTSDGIARGGSRIAKEVNDALQRDSFATISMLGNSLGGLYARYALSEIKFNEFNGLRPATFVTTAAPHIGVKSDTLYGPALAVLSRVTVNMLPNSLSQSARDLVNESDGILNALLEDPRFLQPLQTFQARKALAPLSKDFMVPFSSALFTKLSPSQFMSRAQKRRISNLVDLYEINNTILPTPSVALKLAQIGWSFSAVDLSPPDEPLPLNLLPLAHNKLVALERTGIKRLASPFERTAIGRPVMDDLADWIMKIASSPTKINKVEACSQAAVAATAEVVSTSSRSINT